MNGVINVLVVDDVEQNLVAIEALLARPGLNVLKALSGQEALEILLTQKIALALIDVQMPEMDGFELAELIRGSDRTRTVPLIFLTAAREPRMAFRGYEAGAVDFLHKPIDAEALKSKVNVFVELHAKEQQLSRQVEELRQAMRLIEMFTAVLGHDLRTPLAAVINGAELVERVAADNPAAVSAAKRIFSSGQRMSEMVEQLLDVARARSGNIALKPENLDYRAVCANVVEEVRRAHSGAEIVFDTRGDTWGCADPGRLSQAITNLLVNAVQHGTSGTPVQLLVDGTARKRMTIEVRNGGVVPRAKRDTLFEPFQLCMDEPRQGHGLGLGLYIVKAFVEAHGGEVFLRSDPHQGTSFTVSLPRSAAGGG